MSTKYKFTGNQQEHEATLRQFTLDELLKCIYYDYSHARGLSVYSEILRNGDYDRFC